MNDLQDSSATTSVPASSGSRLFRRGRESYLRSKGPCSQNYGSSKAYAVYNAILKERQVESDATGQIKKAIAESDEISSGEAKLKQRA